MKQTAANYSEAHFDAKAARYHAALSASPLARTFEILPFLMLLSHHARLDWGKPSKLADLLCGSGYLTSHLSPCFPMVVGIDVSSRMLDHYPAGGKFGRIKAAIETHPDVLKELRPNIIASLAGLHHVYEQDDGVINEKASHAIQANLLSEWASAVAPNGCMIAADVTAPEEGKAFSIDDSVLAWHDTPLSNLFKATWQTFGRYLKLPDTVLTQRPASMRQFVDTVLAIAPETRRAEPALWFREVVTKHGLYGHNDHFLKARKLRNSLRLQGLNIRYHEMPTPWAFSSEDDFVYFFHEKFALGPPAKNAGQVETSIRDFIIEQADHFLGLTRRPDGSVLAGWRLGYYIVIPTVDGGVNRTSQTEIDHSG